MKTKAGGKEQSALRKNVAQQKQTSEREKEVLLNV